MQQERELTTPQAKETARQNPKEMNEQRFSQTNNHPSNHTNEQGGLSSLFFILPSDLDNGYIMDEPQQLKSKKKKKKQKPRLIDEQFSLCQ